MSNVSEWVNEMRRASSAAVDFKESMNGLYESMTHNANRHHQLRYASMDPPQTPPAISVQGAMKQWLEDNGIPQDLPVPVPDESWVAPLTSNDLWLSALALNGMINSLSVSDLEYIFRTAQ